LANLPHYAEELLVNRTARPISWIKAARRDFEAFPAAVQLDGLRALTVAAEGAERGHLV
jgi:hypothetical protein